MPALPPPPAFRPKRPVDEPRSRRSWSRESCDNCHKEDFSGQGETGRIWPGSGTDYLIKALRTSAAAPGAGRGLAAMMEVSVTLQDEDIEMIARYLARKP